MICKDVMAPFKQNTTKYIKEGGRKGEREREREVASNG